MRNILLIFVLLITPSFHRCAGASESVFPNVVVKETAKHGGIGVEPEFDHISTEPRVMFPADDGRTMQLLKPGANHDQLELNQMVLERLAAIEEPLSFVSVVGPYHGYHSHPSKSCDHFSCLHSLCALLFTIFLHLQLGFTEYFFCR